MELSDRKKKILEFVVSDYIETAIPVSSKSITEKHMFNISSSTVRSELSALEELGYLSQPHTSAGRVPSTEAYKLYVTELMGSEKLTSAEIDYIKEIFLDKSQGLEGLVKNTAKVISELTQNTTLAVATHDSDEVIKNIKLFRFQSDSALLVIVTDTKLLKDTVITFNEDMPDERISDANALLEKIFIGKSFAAVTNADFEIEEAFESYKNVFLKVLDALKFYVSKSDDVILEGEDKILQHPEYANIDKLKNFMSVVTKKDKIVDLLTDDGRDIKINIKIGTDGYTEIPEDCSLVSATYSVNGVKLGTYGVIGPIRMDYKKIVAVLENVGKILENIITNR